jgi:hypothetical protein
MHTLPNFQSTDEYREDWNLCAGISDLDNDFDTPEDLHKDREMLLAGEISSDEYIHCVNMFFTTKID